ncbi:MAG: hypothetical protein ACYTE8_09665 [Planctomycetota bacterium]|jgi:hypothetical protein
MTPTTLQTAVVDAPARSAVDTTFVALKDLSPGEKQAASAIIERVERQGKVDLRWIASFIKVLTVLKAEERRFG